MLFTKKLKNETFKYDKAKKVSSVYLYIGKNLKNTKLQFKYF